MVKGQEAHAKRIAREVCGENFHMGAFNCIDLLTVFSDALE